MSYPRAVIQPRAAAYHQKHGLKATCVRYGFAYRTMRRWLVERGVEIRPWGLRIGQTLRGQRKIEES